MKVLLDAVHVQAGMKGVGRYVYNTIARLGELGGAARYTVLVLEGVPAEVDLPRSDAVEYRTIRMRSHRWHCVYGLPALCRRVRPDVALVPYETPLAPLPVPTGIVCHDIPVLMTEAQKRTGLGRASRARELIWRVDHPLTMRTLRRADRVFCNSEFVAGWLRTKGGVGPTRLRLAPCAPGADFAGLSRAADVPERAAALGVAEPYLLVFYTGDERENFGVVPPAFDRLVRSGADLSLVVAGVRDHARPVVEGLLEPYAWRDRVRVVPFLGQGREGDLAALYARAFAYLETSLHEGFGMQVVEAMACGTPVVTSTGGALPEVAGGAALLADPTDPGAMAAEVGRLLADPELRADLSTRGAVRAAHFTWERTARAIRDGLEEIALRRPGRRAS